MATLTPEQIIDQVTAPMRKRMISGPTSKESPGVYVIANLKTPANPETAQRITTAEYDRRIVRAASIVYAESGGKTDAVCYNVNDAQGRPTCSPRPPAGPRGVDRGLWQWNSVAWPQITDLQAFDRDASTEIAFTVSNAYTSFGPWSKSRGMDPNSAPSKTIAAAYDSMLGRAVDDTPILSTIDPDANGVPNALGSVLGWTEALGRLLSNLVSPAFWTRFGIGALGVALVVAAIVVLGRRAILNTATGGIAGALTKG